MEQFNEKQTQEVQQTPSFSSSFKRDLRYILTQKCNYNCSFCHKEWCDGSEKELLNSDDYLYLYDMVKNTIPLHWVTLSWWEPLLKKNIENILHPLKEKWAFLSMVTNWSLIEKHIQEIWYLDRINISLHTVQQDIYETIVWKNNSVEKVMNNILLIKKIYPDLDVRINSTLLKSYFNNHASSIHNTLNFIQQHNITLKYLELSPKDHPLFVPKHSIIPFLEEQWFTLQKNNNLSRNERTYCSWWAKVILRECSCDFAQNHGLDQNFCKKNNDIVVSPDGKISSCILDTKKIDLYWSIKERNDKKIIKKIRTLQDTNFTYNCCLNK